MLKPVNQIAIGNKSGLIEAPEEDTLAFWCEMYFAHAVTTAETSRKVQMRDISLFVRFAKEEGVVTRPLWSPRLSRAFQDFLRKFRKGDGTRYWSDRTANRILAHVKTLAKWVHHLAPFPLGNPMQEIRLMAVGSNLDVERALSPTERRRILDAADLLPSIGGKSKDRRRNRDTDPTQRPVRKNARPWRNRAMVYTLIETGMRRAGVVNLDLKGIDWDHSLIKATEKGGTTHPYPVSSQGLSAIRDYIEHERHLDKDSPALFLPVAANSSGRLTPLVVNQIWSEVCTLAQVKGKSPHTARHAMGRHIIDKTGNIAAVQRQLGHKNVAYSVQYTRVSNKEMLDVLNDRT